MFIELTDMLRCPRDHEESYLVLVPERMDARRVVTGLLGCPVCQAEYPVREGVADFGGAPPSSAGGAVADAAALQAFLGLDGRGGYVVLAGSAAAAAHELAAAEAGVHVVAVNPPAGVPSGVMVSVLRAPDRLPFKTRHARGVVLGDDCSSAAWTAEGARVLLPGLRLVVLADVPVPAGVTELARSAGAVVGERRAG